jgi:general stress protein YciG
MRPPPTAPGHRRRETPDSPGRLHPPTTPAAGPHHISTSKETPHMTWFKVDDKFHSHNKTRKVLAEAPIALALWVVAGSWSSDNLTDGFVPDHQLPWLIPVGSEDMARQLVAARFWKRVRGGYQFHEWSSDSDGTKRNPTRDEVETDRRRKAEAGRKGGLARSKATATSGNGSSTRQAPASASAKAGATEVLDPPTRPVPKGRVGSTGRSLGELPPTHASSDPPSPRCGQHADVDEPPPCGPCADARRARTRWDLADAERRRTQPQCRTHRGQPAHNCGLCRADALALEDA